MIAGPPIATTDLPLELFAKGKVRDTYVIDDNSLLMISTDRLSAFDHVLPSPIPDRGKVLTQLSIYWFSQTHDIIGNHLISGMVPDLPDALKDHRGDIAGRFMIVRKAKRIDVECVVRGYLAGSGWSEYKEHGTLAGEPLPPGMLEAQQLATPLFTPATKNDHGHDENISFAQMQKMVGEDLATRLKDVSIALYARAAEMALWKNVILADTKFEFGTVGENDDLIVIDEVLTPDSSRYWDGALYTTGRSPESYDKQFVRDWLLKSGWDRNSPPPELPEDIVQQTRARYLTAYEKIVGRPLFPPKQRNE